MSKEFIIETVLNTFKYEKELFEECNMMIAGGVFTSLFTKKEVNDVDCYFRSKDDLVRFLNYITEYGNTRFCISITDKSVTLIGGSVPIQLIYFKYFENLQDVFNTFDFTISMCGYDFKTKQLEHHPDFFSDLAQRRLSFNKNTAYPLVSALRVNKFKDRGYNISRSEMIKLLLTVSQLEIKTPRQFIEQIGGFYGNSALASLSKLDEKDFDLEKGLKVLSESSEGSNPEINKVISNTPESKLGVHQLARLIHSDNPLEGGWYREDNTAYYKSKYSRHSIPLDIALLFAPHNEVHQRENPEEPVSGMFYKWVYKTENPNVFKSIHRDSFLYELGKDAVDEKAGLFFCKDSDIKSHYFASREGAVMLMCLADIKDRTALKSNELRFTKVKVLSVVDEPYVVSPDLPTGDFDSKFDIKPSENHCRNEELELEDVPSDSENVEAKEDLSISSFTPNLMIKI